MPSDHKSKARLSTALQHLRMRCLSFRRLWHKTLGMTSKMPSQRCKMNAPRAMWWDWILSQVNQWIPYKKACMIATEYFETASRAVKGSRAISCCVMNSSKRDR